MKFKIIASVIVFVILFVLYVISNGSNSAESTGDTYYETSN